MRSPVPGSAALEHVDLCEAGVNSTRISLDLARWREGLGNSAVVTLAVQ